MINKYDDDDDDDDDVWCGLLFLFICVQCVMTSVYTCAMYIVTWLSLDNTRSTSPVRTHYSHRLAYFSYLFIYSYIHSFISSFIYLLCICTQSTATKSHGYVQSSSYLFTYLFIYLYCPRWWRSTVVERRSLTGELSLSCARPATDGWPLMWVSHPLQVSQLGQLSLSSFRGR